MKSPRRQHYLYGKYVSSVFYLRAIERTELFPLCLFNAEHFSKYTGNRCGSLQTGTLDIILQSPVSL